MALKVWGQSGGQKGVKLEVEVEMGVNGGDGSYGGRVRYPRIRVTDRSHGSESRIRITDQSHGHGHGQDNSASSDYSHSHICLM